MTIFDLPDFDDHELVSFVSDAKAGLRAIVAIHWSGPIGTAGGGCRVRAYPDDAAALRDVLRLSRAMSYKLALVGLPGGGAKSVILADPRNKTPALLRAFGRAVNGLGGRYIVAEDVGTTPADMEEIAKETEYVVGRAIDTSPTTGYGVFVGLEAAVAHHLHREVRGLRVAIQGVGGVGFHLGRELKRQGARLHVSDPNPATLERAVRELGATPVPPDAIYDLDVDVFSPCAFGDVLDDDTIPRLRARVIAGGANNQLADPRHATLLQERGIFYAPDFVLNAGGVIAAAEEVGRFGDEDDDPRGLEAAARDRTRVIAKVLRDVIALADARGITPDAAAAELARARMGGRE